MKPLKKLIVAASAGLAAALMTSLPGLALAQGEAAFEAEEDEWAEDYDCAEDDDCEETDAEDDAGGVWPSEGTTADEASGEPVLVTPGSTEESNPGGSTRPGTTPDN